MLPSQERVLGVDFLFFKEFFVCNDEGAQVDELAAIVSHQPDGMLCDTEVGREEVRETEGSALLGLCAFWLVEFCAVLVVSLHSFLQKIGKWNL